MGFREKANIDKFVFYFNFFKEQMDPKVKHLTYHTCCVIITDLYLLIRLSANRNKNDVGS